MLGTVFMGLGVSACSRPENYTPKQAALAFVDALDNGDMPRARSLSHGTDTDLANAKGQLDCDRALHAYMAAEKVAFGHTEMPNQPLEKDAIQTYQEKIEGSSAELLDSSGSAQIYLVQDNGWKVDAHRSVGFVLGNPALEYKAIVIVTKCIAAGRYQTEQEAHDDLMQEMEKQNKTTSAQDASAASTNSPPSTPESSAPNVPAPSAEATAWANDYFQAPFVSQNQLLKSLKTVRLVIKANPTMLRNAGMDVLTNVATAVLQENGLTVDPQSPFTLTVDSRLFLNNFTIPRINTDSGVRDDWKFKVFAQYVGLAVSTKTASYRNGTFIPVEARPINTGEMRQHALGHDLEGSEAENYYSSVLKDALEDLFNITNKVDGPADSNREQFWLQTRWPASLDFAMYQTYNAALQAPPEDYNRMFKGLTSLEAGVDQNSSGVNANDLKTQWTQTIQNAGFQVLETGTNLVFHYVGEYKGFMNPIDLGFMEDSNQYYYDDWSHIEVIEFYTVYPLNGKLCRSPCSIWESENFTTSTVDDNPATVQDLISRDMDNFSKEAGYRR